MLLVMKRMKKTTQSLPKKDIKHIIQKHKNKLHQQVVSKNCSAAGSKKCINLNVKRGEILF